MKESSTMVFSKLRISNKLFQTSASILLSSALVLATPFEAAAKPGGSGSSGSRGTRTYSAPAATPTAPKPAAPIERSATPAPAAPSTATPAAARAPQAAPAPAPAAAAAANKPRFGTGMMAGLLGAGLMGAVLGAGFSGGLGGIMSFIGVFLQMALLAGIVFFAIRWFRNRSTPATATANANTMRRDAVNLGNTMGNAPSASSHHIAPTRQDNARPENNRPVQINPADFASFEKLLGDIQMHYSAENLNALRAITTPEMASYFVDELSENAKKGQVNRITDVKLLQGDLSESWGEPGVDYATVAMRFALTDVMLERATGKQVASYNNGAQDATELWTFVREVAGSWKLSAIQQAS
jgi:predicted lipid-binding transport protein (Tim44 family)